MKVFASYNIKGGVGKTSTAVNLAHLSAREGRRTLLWDLDPQAAATYMFRVKPRVKGGGHALVTGKRPLEDAIRATDFGDLDLLPADFSYRNLDLDLDDAKKRTRRLRQLIGTLPDVYDVVFLDPPSFSTSKGMEGTLDIQRDHVALIEASARVLAPGGTLVFSTNLRKFKLDEEALTARGLTAADITASTIPPDFARNPRIHRCFVVRRA